jgi:hypothetical protein
MLTEKPEYIRAGCGGCGMTQGKFVGQGLDRWRRSEYASRREEVIFPTLRWNCKRTASPPMYLLEESAKLAQFVDDAQTWKPGEFIFEPNEQTLTIVKKSCWYCCEPILSIIDLYTKRIIFRKDIGEHKKGDLVPAGMEYNHNIHTIKGTYLVAILELQNDKIYPYRLLHEKPLLWTPPSSVGAIFRSRIYLPFCSLINNELGDDLPKHLFAIHLTSVLERVGSTGIVVNVPVSIIPKTKDELLKFYVGDHLAETFDQWYMKFCKNKNKENKKIFDSDFIDQDDENQFL